MKGALPLIVVCGVAVALVVGLSAALVLNVQGRRQMTDDHAVELAVMRRASGEQEAALVALRAELDSSQAQIIALHGTLEGVGRSADDDLLGAVDVGDLGPRALAGSPSGIEP